MGETSFFKELLYAALALAGIATFALTRDKLRSGFLLFVFLLGLGFRTYPLSPQLKIIPAELVLAGLPLLLLGSKPLPGTTPGSVALPWWLLLMLPFWLVAWLPSPTNSFPLDARIAEFRNFLLLVPMFLVAPAVLARPGGWRAVGLAFWGVSVWLSAMGLVEHYVPGVAHAIPGFMGNPDPIIAGEFERCFPESRVQASLPRGSYSGNSSCWTNLSHTAMTNSFLLSCASVGKSFTDEDQER